MKKKNPIDLRHNAPLERAFYHITSSFSELVKSKTAGGVVLFISAVIALVAINSPLASIYQQFINTEISLRIGQWELTESLALWVNDGLMGIFFLLVGLEIKREIIFGELSTLKKAALPVIAATGGMVLPAFIYYSINSYPPASVGWGIPVATDIAFAIGVLALLGNRVPKNLYIFLITLAIVDDMGVVAIISIFYTDSISTVYLSQALLILLFLAFLNLVGIRNSLPYYLIGSLMWFTIHLSGIHPSISGVLVAITIPAYPKTNPQYFREKIKAMFRAWRKKSKRLREIPDDEEQHDVTLMFEETTSLTKSTLHNIADTIRTPVIFLIMPLFAFVNSGVAIDVSLLASDMLNPVPIGIILGLTVGKFVGILSFSLIAVKLGFAKMPSRMTTRHISGAAILGGMGFTMAIFIAGLAFRSDPELLRLAKMGILVATAFAGTIGYSLLRFGTDKKHYRVKLPEDFKHPV